MGAVIFLGRLSLISPGLQGYSLLPVLLGPLVTIVIYLPTGNTAVYLCPLSDLPDRGDICGHITHGYLTCIYLDDGQVSSLPVTTPVRCKCYLYLYTSYLYDILVLPVGCHVGSGLPEVMIPYLTTPVHLTHLTGKSHRVQVSQSPTGKSGHQGR